MKILMVLTSGTVCYIVIIIKNYAIIIWLHHNYLINYFCIAIMLEKYASGYKITSLYSNE